MTEESQTLRVISYNIHKGFSAARRRFVLPRIRDAIREARADLVFLQEVQGEHRGRAKRTEGWPDASQFEFLADEIWPHFAYGKNAVRSHGHHGNAILSRYPIIESVNTDISTNPFEQRGMLHATLQIPGCKKRAHALCLHLGLTQRGRSAQLKRICELIRDLVDQDEPLIAAGDFNDWSQLATTALASATGLKEIHKFLHGRYARTFPSSLPILALDRIYFRGLTPLRAEAMSGKAWRKLSDHAAVSAEFKLRS